MLEKHDDKRFTYVKIKDDTVTLRYHEEPTMASAPTKHTVKCARDPHPDFVAALQRLTPDLASIMQLPSGYSDAMQLRSLTVRYSDGELSSFTLSGQKPLRSSNTPASINTPAGAEPPGGLLDRVNALFSEAAAYLAGKMAQTELQFGDGQRAEPATDDAPPTEAMTPTP